MTLHPPISRRRRFVEFLPVVTALLAYGAAQNRWVIAGPLLLILTVVLALELDLLDRTFTFYASAAAGGMLGYLLLSFGDPPPSVAVPPNVASTAGGALAALASYLLVVRRTYLAWTAAWVLAAIAFQVPLAPYPQQPPWVVLPFLATTLLAILFAAYPTWTTWSRQLSYYGFVLAMAIPCGLLISGVVRFDNWIVGSVDRFIKDFEPPTGLGLVSRIDLPSKGEVPPSTQIILELSGTVPSKLRSGVLNEFNGTTWKNPDAGPKGLDPRMAPKRLNPPPPPSAAMQREMEELIAASLGGIVPAPAGTWSLNMKATRVESGWIWRAPAMLDTPVTVNTSLAEQLPQETVDDPELTEVPNALEGPMLTFARQIVGDARTPRDQAVRIERYLQSQFEYSLKTDLRDTRSTHTNPLIVLMRDHRPAYCVYFASAMAVMLRTLHVPARVVEGFVPSDRNPFTGRYVVRQRDAHAWVEAYMPDEGRFVAFDPTPGRTREIGSWQKVGLLQGALEAALSTAWRTWIAFRDDPFGWLKAIARSPVSWVIALGLAIWQYRRSRGQGGGRRLDPLQTADPTLRRSYDRYLRMLRGVDVLPAPGETDDELIVRLGRLRGEQSAAAAATFVKHYRGMRYAGSPVVSAELVALLETLRLELRRSRRLAA
jgi:transglutaminase-like putative cysteine protease